jgi:hypothetical protein
MERVSTWVEKEFDTREAVEVLGNAFGVITEARLLRHICSEDESMAVRRRLLETELQRLSKHARLYSFTPKQMVHAAILAESHSIILDG